MEHVSFCPHRINIDYDWSSVQQTEHTSPVTFTGAPRDVDVAEVCKEVEAGIDYKVPSMTPWSSINANRR